MAHFNSGDYAKAFTELRSAGFGFVEQIEKLETVEAYAAIAAHRLGHEADARDALLRIVSAEKIQPHFRSIKLPADLRAEIDITAATLMTSDEATALGVSEQAQKAAAAAKPPVTVPTPTKRPNVAVTAPSGPGDADAAPPGSGPRPAAPQPRSLTPQPVTPAPQPVTPTPQPAAPSQPTSPQSRPAPLPRQADPVPQPVAPPPRPEVPRPVIPTTTPAPQPEERNADASLAEAQSAVDDGDLARARSIYKTLVRGPQLPHAAALRLAEGLYRMHDFAGSARAFQHAGALGHGEERYHYYYAVALYETGHHRDAKRELAASLPFITMTAEVAHYRAKIEK